MPVLPGAFSPVHLAVIALVALLVLGPDKLPELARKASQLHRDYKKVLSTIDDHVRDVVDDVVPTDLNAAIPPSLAPPKSATPPSRRGARTWPPDNS
jgi:sec-independent protein translocase protein TatA